MTGPYDDYYAQIDDDGETINDLTFTQWLKAVDAILARHLQGFTHLDLVDFPSRDTWNDEATPAEGALVCLEWQDLPVPAEVIKAIEAEAKEAGR